MQPFDMPPLIDEPGETPAEQRPRSWQKKFHDAFRGLKLGVRGHSSFFVHFFFMALVLAAAGMLRCDVMQWCVLLLCIGGVLTAELFNSALETLVRGLEETTKDRCWPSLDIAAGAVLLASVSAVLVGALVFAQRFVQILWPE